MTELFPPRGIGVSLTNSPPELREIILGLIENGSHRSTNITAFKNGADHYKYVTIFSLDKGKRRYVFFHSEVQTLDNAVSQSEFIEMYRPFLEFTRLKKKMSGS